MAFAAVTASSFYGTNKVLVKSLKFVFPLLRYLFIKEKTLSADIATYLAIVEITGPSTEHMDANVIIFNYSCIIVF